jgi:hypothetical protein
MGKHSAQTEAAIDRRIAATLPTGSPNAMTVAELRELAVEYLQDHDQEVAENFSIAGEPHWDLWMMDARLEDALFIVLVFHPHGVEFFCGTGDAFAIKRFAGSEFPDDPGALFTEMSRRFAVPQGRLCLDRAAAEAWLGRSW